MTNLTPRLMVAIITDGMKQNMADASLAFGVPFTLFLEKVRDDIGIEMWSDKHSNEMRVDWLLALTHYHRLDSEREPYDPIRYMSGID